MFYSHDMLTSRQYGVATIWLVATLGAKSNLKKVTRRAILDVNLPKACETITEPEVPIALRLQGSLLFGVSRVYAQQCGYVLADVTSLRDKMRVAEHTAKEKELDPELGKTRPEQLNLAEDPYFVPDVDINFDLAVFGLSSDSSTTSKSLPSLTASSSQSSLLFEDLEEPDLVMSSADTPADLGEFDVHIGVGTSSALRTGSRPRELGPVFNEELAVIEDPVFEIDDDGFLHPARSPGMTGILGSGAIALPQQAIEAGTSDRGVAERGDTVGLNESGLNFNDDVMMFGDDEPVLPPQAPLIPLTPEPMDAEVEAQPDRGQTSSVHVSEVTSETAEAPQRHLRPAKYIRPDQQTELSNRDLNAWNHDYLANMAAALRGRRSRRLRIEGKKTAEFWLFQQGIGNIAGTFGNDRVVHPLALFSGQSLWDMLRGPGSGTKRSRSSSLDEEDEEEQRRVRPRTVSQGGLARGEDGEEFQYVDDDGLMLQGDDMNIESEVGRQAPPSLPDHSSSMPWNVSGSRHSSAQAPGSGLFPRLSSSVGGIAGGMDLGPPSAFGRRGSRFTSASPLLGRGLSLSRLGSQEAPDLSQVSINEDDFADLDMQLGADLDPEFELYGPSAAVDTQTAAQSQWVAATLENEAFNFLTFVRNQIPARDEEQAGMEEGEREDDEDEGTTKEVTITLDKLLPPTQNSKVVGAQALLHVLALATKGLIQVYQAEAFGEIEIAVVSA